MIIVFAIGFILGVATSFAIFRICSAGALVIDVSDTSDGPYMFLRIFKSIDFITKKKYICLRVNAEGIIPHK